MGLHVSVTVHFSSFVLICAETPFGNLERCFAYFKDLVLCHAVKVCIYLVQDMSHILEIFGFTFH